ncbi:MAG: urea carboxylase-associated family protein [Solirubrobacteraceae bacterium]
MEPLLSIELAPGATWSHVLKRGTAMQISDLEGGANVAVMLYNAANTLERYSMPDTLKAQHVARLTQGDVLFSGEGRVLCSIVADSCGWHDPIGGCGVAEPGRYGDRSYQELRNDFARDAREGFLVELAKYGLGARDLLPSLNLFSKVAVGPAGELEFSPGNSVAGDSVVLRAELDVLILLCSAPHALDDAREYSPRRVQLEIVPSAPPAADDPCLTRCPENERGFRNTREYLL